jgi:hypothetical protein
MAAVVSPRMAHAAELSVGGPGKSEVLMSDATSSATPLNRSNAAPRSSAISCASTVGSPASRRRAETTVRLRRSARSGGTEASMVLQS